MIGHFFFSCKIFNGRVYYGEIFLSLFNLVTEIYFLRTNFSFAKSFFFCGEYLKEAEYISIERMRWIYNESKSNRLLEYVGITIYSSMEMIMASIFHVLKEKKIENSN